MMNRLGLGLLMVRMLVISGTALLLASVVPAAAQPALSSGANSAADAKLKAEIAAVVQANIIGFSTRNLDLIMSAYSPYEDLIVFDITPPMKYVGAKALRALNERWLKEFTGKIEGSYSDLNVASAGDIVYGYNIQRWKFTRPDGSIFSFNARLTNIYRKIDGRWRTIQEHGSVPVILATGKAALDAE